MQFILVFWIIKTACSLLHIQAIKYHHSLFGSVIETNLLKEILAAMIHIGPFPLIIALIGTIVFYFFRSSTAES